MAGFDHYIITRFNLKQSVWSTDKAGALVNNEDWLNERFDIFENYCFPSIKNQTIKTFKWLVYFDADTPELFKKKNEALKSECEAFFPIYVSSFSEFESRLPETVKTLKASTNDYIITTRLDNDDAFHENAVKVIQQNFVAKDKTIIDLSNGLALQVIGTYKLSLKRNTVSGPFISLVEYIDSDTLPLTVYDREHTTWDGTASFKTVKSGFYWLQIIHERNISNGLSNDLTFNKAYLKGFNFLKPIHFSFKYYTFIILKRLKVLRLVKRIVK